MKPALLLKPPTRKPESPQTRLNHRPNQWPNHLVTILRLLHRRKLGSAQTRLHYYPNLWPNHLVTILWLLYRRKLGSTRIQSYLHLLSR